MSWSMPIWRQLVRLPKSRISAAARLGLNRVDTFDVIVLGRHFWPRLFAMLLLAALVFFPRPLISLIAAEAKQRGQEISTLLVDALLPAAEQGEKRAAGHRNGLAGARLPD